MTILVPATKQGAVEQTASRCSNLVLRLIRAQNDPVKRRLRNYLLEQSDDRLKASLGFSDIDIRVLRGG